MKTFIATFLILTTSLSFAHEITKEEYFALREEQKLVYESVEVGMTSEYTSNFFSGANESQMEECFKKEKSVVISTDHPRKYLVYKKETLLEDCGNFKKGQSKEFLVWMEKHKLNIEKMKNNPKITYKKILLQNDIVIINGQVGESIEFEEIFDLKKSQFYNLIEQTDDEFTTKLLRRGYTDPDSINIENLEITEYP